MQIIRMNLAMVLPQIKWLLLLLMPLAVLSTSCDPDRKRKCEWYLVPEPDHIDRVDEGMIPVCARNFTNYRQYCRLQATLKFTEEQYGRRFRFVDMEIDKTGTFPRRVVSIKYCE